MFGCHESGQKHKTFLFMPTWSLDSREISGYGLLLHFGFSIIESKISKVLKLSAISK